MAQWTTPAELDLAYDTIAASIEGWRPPVLWAVGASSASSSADYEFPVVNADGAGRLPAVVLAKTVSHASGSLTHVLSVTELQHAVDGLAPAQACTSLPHPNLAAWRHLLHEVDSNPARTLVAVFVGDLDEPVGSEAEASLRQQLG